MATSGVVTYQATGTEIIRRAFLSLGYIDETQSPTATQTSDALVALNYLIKNWSGSPNYFPGFKAWTRRTAYLWMQDSTTTYTVGGTSGTANGWTETYARTKLSSAEVAGTSLAVDSITGFTNGDFLAVEESNTLKWTTVNGVPSAGVITSAAAITAPADAYVWGYTTKARNPLAVETVTLVDTNDDRILLYPLTWKELAAYSELKNVSQPWGYHFQPGRLYGTIIIDCYPEETNNLLEVRYISAIEDMAAAGNDIEMPQAYYLPLCYALAEAMATKGDWTPDMEQKFVRSLTAARDTYAEEDHSFFLQGEFVEGSYTNDTVTYI
jgi:hypothetical protein